MQGKELLEEQIGLFCTYQLKDNDDIKYQQKIVKLDLDVESMLMDVAQGGNEIVLIVVAC